MSKPKLIYFNLTGLGEPARVILSYGNIEFEDFRFDKADWPSLRPAMPYGQVPVLEIDGHTLHQSLSICRYLAHKLNIAGQDLWEQTRCNMAVETINEYRSKVTAFFYDPDPNVWKDKFHVVVNEIAPYYLSKFEAQVENNGGYFVGGALTWTDLFFFALNEYLCGMTQVELLENFPNLRVLDKKILNLPQMKAYHARRPPSSVGNDYRKLFF